MASVVTRSIDLSLFLGFFPPSALVLSIAWPHSHHYEQTFPTWWGMADMEMPNPPSGQDLMPAVRTAVSQQPQPPYSRSHLSHSSIHLVTDRGWPATWAPCRIPVGFLYSRAPCQVSWGFAKPSLQSSMYLFHSFCRGWSLINTLLQTPENPAWHSGCQDLSKETSQHLGSVMLESGLSLPLWLWLEQS